MSTEHADPDRERKLEAVHPRHPVVADDTVDFLDSQPVKAVAGACFDYHVEFVIVSFQKRGGEFANIRLIIDVENPDHTRV